MSLCRPIISQVVPKYPRWKSIQKLQNVCHVTTISKRPRNSRGGVWTRDTHIQTAYSWSLPTTQVPMPPVLPEAEVERTVREPPPVTVDTYFTLRQQDKSLVATLPKSSYLHVLDAALENESYELVDSVVSDILDVYQGSEHERFGLLHATLSREFLVLGHRVMLRMCRYLDEHKDYQLDATLVQQTVRLLSKLKTFKTDELHGLQIVTASLIRLILDSQVPGGTKSITFQPPKLVYFTFALLRKLLNESHQEVALDIFRSLVEAKFVPPEAMEGVDQLSQDFNTILRVALTKACLHWHWRPLASAFLVDTLESSRSKPHQAILNLNIDIFYELLNTPTSRDINACEQLIRRVHPISPAPNSIIRLFYNHAYEQGSIHTAEKLYDFTRSASVQRLHSYPPPSGQAVVWLMEHLSSRSRRSALARTLATEVVDNNINIPPLLRAPFITRVAARGDAMLARRLWERYAVGQGRKEVVGNSALMIRMVSLFESLSRKARMSIQSNQEDGRSPLSKQGIHERLEHAHSLHAFAKHVLHEFRSKYIPFSTAPHFALTSYARGCFMLGKYSEGLEAFASLLRRKELPDLHDINVALSAVAQTHPEQAVEIVQRMEQRSLQPDAVTYGTILHCALTRGDHQLVTDMLTKLKALSDQPMSLKTLTNIIRASAEHLPGESVEAMQSKLSMVLNLIATHPEANIASSTQTGKYLVYQALRAQEPVLAFKFWQRCLKSSAQWDDLEQRVLRRRIARTVQEQSDRFNPILVSSILTQLSGRPGLTPPP